MWWSTWLAVGVLATLSMTSWALLYPEERVYLTAGTSAIGYLTMAWTAPGVQRVTQSGVTVDAPVSVVVQLIAGLLGVLSVVVLFLYRLGEYPPPDEELQT
jgi:tetrahydromethanopterin S-methyltransferase subunit C